jgi:ABC-type transporter MlaC component
VVEDFVLVTLSTLPNATFDYEAAQALMTEAYAAEYDTPDWVPRTYGIQDGPTSYEIADEEVAGSSATVTVLGYWGADLGREWRFTVEQEGGAWKVANIDILGSEDGGGEADAGAVDARTPSEVVQAFVDATLATDASGSVDPDAARGLMTEAYAPRFDEPGFVPLTYGIQDSPTSTEVGPEVIDGSTASVTVLGYWGSDLGREWRFTLEMEGGAWKVANIEIVEEDGGDGGTGSSAFWQLDPVVSEFTVYDNGGYKLVVDFDQPTQDIEATFRIAYFRQDDGTLAYDQERSGVVEAGRYRLTLDSDWSGYDLAAMGFQTGAHDVIAYIDGVEIASGELIVN